MSVLWKDFKHRINTRKMDKENIRKEFNEFLDSASDETIKDFLKFIKDRKANKKAKTEKKNGIDPFRNRSN